MKTTWPWIYFIPSPGESSQSQFPTRGRHHLKRQHPGPTCSSYINFIDKKTKVKAAQKVREAIKHRFSLVNVSLLSFHINQLATKDLTPPFNIQISPPPPHLLKWGGEEFNTPPHVSALVQPLCNYLSCIRSPIKNKLCFMIILLQERCCCGR